MIGVIKGTMRQKKEVNGLPLPIASYKTQLKAPIRSLKVAITAVQSGSGDPAPDNIRPIIGASESNVVRCGKNLFSYDLPIRDGYWSGTTFNGTNAIIPKAQAYLWKYIRVYVEELTTITLSGFDTQGGANCAWLGSEDTSDVLGVFDASLKNGTKTVPNGAKYVCLTIYGINVKYETYDEAQLEVGSTATTYEQYQGNTYTIQLGDTYYGGSLDVTTGVLTVTHKRVDLGSLPFLYYDASQTFRATISDAELADFAGQSTAMCEIYAKTTAYSNVPNGSFIMASRYFASTPIIVIKDTNYTDKDTFKSAVSGYYLRYELATPITVQLTPTQVEQLLGTNNVWADTGDVEELIYTDRQVYYGR